MTTKRSKNVLVVLGSLALLSSTALASFLVGERVGRGRGCLSSALAWRGPTGLSIGKEVLSRPGSIVDYTFWGDNCSISAGFPSDSGWVGGRWAYVPAKNLLFAVDSSGEALIPGLQSWGDYVVASTK